MNTDELIASVAAVRELAAKATPGPWRWVVSLHSKQVRIEAQIRTFEYVMDFVRWGMSGAKPRFRKGPIDNVLMHGVEEFAVPVAEREHHAGWYRTVEHPDAQMMLAARNLDWPAIEAALRRAKAAEGLAEEAESHTTHDHCCAGGQCCSCGAYDMIQALADYRAAAKE